MAHPYQMVKKKAAKRALTRDSCDGKNKYVSEIQALMQAAVRSTSKIKLRAYPCRHCNNWHLTSSEEKGTPK